MKISLELAELLGIIIGDGNIYASRYTYRLIITGHSENDFLYLTKYVRKLIKNNFNLDPYIWKHKNKKAIAIAVCSKELLNHLSKYNLHPGPKINIKIPEIILKNKSSDIKARFLRGLADTDFSVMFKKGSSRKIHSYPVISSTFSSKYLVKDIKRVLKEFKIKGNIYFKKITLGNKKFLNYQIDIYGKKNLDLWLKRIGFKNEKHLKKIEIWKKLGYYLPKYKPQMKHK